MTESDNQAINTVLDQPDHPHHDKHDTKKNETDIHVLPTKKEFYTDISMNYILFWAVILGLMMNWLAMYLKISMGFVSVGIGPMAVLLIGRQILRRKNAATRKNLVTIIIAYGATQAAEASVGLLFLLWLATNASFFGMTFNPPWWLLPSAEVISARTVFTAEWVVPLLVHYFLMLIPGVLGIVFGWYMKDSFIHDDEKFPFPSTISQNSQVAVLTDEAETKGPLFWRVARYGFVVSLITVIVPGLFVIDLSNLSVGYLMGIMLGPVGIALFAAGILIGKPQLTGTAFFTSTIAYSVLSILLLGSTSGSTDFFEFFTIALRKYYFVPALGIMLGSLILGPIVFGIVGSIFGKKTKQEETEGDEGSGNDKNDVENETNQTNNVGNQKTPRMGLMMVIRKNYKLLGLFTTIYIILILYIQTLQIIPAAPLWGVALLIFWNIIIGGMVNGYLMTAGLAKSGSAITPPFIFDVLPIFLAGGTGFTSFVAFPTSESDGSAGIISSQKLAKMNDISEKHALKAYIAGYMATSLTTPIFALFMWQAFGIGTASFPAPAFPVQGAILASFASRDVTSFIDLRLFAIVLVISIFLSKLGQDVVFGMVIGLLFPPHMALPMALGGLLRVWINRRYDTDKAKDIASTLGPGLAVGASFVIPIMIALALIL